MNLTAEDRKVIVITVAATVAANLITLVLVALAINIARGYSPRPRTPLNFEMLLSITATPALFIVLPLEILRRNLKDKTSFASKVVRVIMLVVISVSSFFLVLLLLVWVGLASGVK